MKHAMRSSEVEARGAAREQTAEGSSGGEVRRQSGITQRPPAANPASQTPEWNTSVVADILGFEYARAVLFTDGQGKLLFSGGSLQATVELAEAADIALAALNQGSQALNFGELDTSIWLCRQGTVVSTSSSQGVRALVLAQPNANLAQLLSHVRRVFAGRHE
ncbi:MAG: hypothetical protein QM778_34065 [Myxococcales bacterium]